MHDRGSHCARCHEHTDLLRAGGQSRLLYLDGWPDSGLPARSARSSALLPVTPHTSACTWWRITSLKSGWGLLDAPDVPSPRQVDGALATASACWAGDQPTAAWRSMVWHLFRWCITQAISHTAHTSAFPYTGFIGLAGSRVGAGLPGVAAARRALLQARRVGEGSLTPLARLVPASSFIWEITAAGAMPQRIFSLSVGAAVTYPNAALISRGWPGAAQALRLRELPFPPARVG